MEEMGRAQGNIATDPSLKVVGTRWVSTPKEPDLKARLVVQGCSTGSRDSFFLVLSCAAQEHWSCGSADAASAYLQAGRTERLLLLMMPKRQPPLAQDAPDRSKKKSFSQKCQHGKNLTNAATHPNKKESAQPQSWRKNTSR